MRAPHIVLAVLAGVGLVVLVVDLLSADSGGEQEANAEPAVVEAMREAAGAYRVGPAEHACGSLESAGIEPPQFFAFRIVMGELVGVPCESAAACRALASDAVPFRYELAPPLTVMGEPSPPELQRLVDSALRVDGRDGETLTGHDDTHAKLEVGACERLVTHTEIRPTAGGLEVHRRVDFVLSTTTDDCSALPLECVFETEMTLVGI